MLRPLIVIIVCNRIFSTHVILKSACMLMCLATFVMGVPEDCFAGDNDVRSTRCRHTELCVSEWLKYRHACTTTCSLWDQISTFQQAPHFEECKSGRRGGLGRLTPVQ